MTQPNQRIIFINSHPIQYFVPLYQQMAREPAMTLEVWYASDETLKGAVDEEFGKQITWDIPLLEGYSYRFFKNYARKPSIFNGFWGLVNWGVVKALYQAPKSLVIVHGWAYWTHLLVVVVAKLFRHTVALRGESPYHHKKRKSARSRLLKQVYLRYFLFRFVDFFLYIGTQNRRFYEWLGVADDRLIFTPYAVDNQRFYEAARYLLPQKNELKARLSLPAQSVVVLCSGKYIAKKRPMDMLAAFQNSMLELSKTPGSPDVVLVMVGEGKLRETMEAFIARHRLTNVYLTGFVNQTEIVQYYATADVFVMCSGIGETWGLVVNEAMNFGVPLLVSELTGSSADLVKRGVNGYVFETGNLPQLTSYLTELLLDAHKRQRMGRASAEIIREYSYDMIIRNLKQMFLQMQKR